MANSKQQKEYNDLLGLTSSLVGKISKSMDELGKQSDKRNKALQEETKLYSSIVGSIKDEVSAQKALNELKKQERDIRNKNYGVNQKDKDLLLIRNKAAQANINKSIQGNKVFNAVQDAVNDNIQKGVDRVDELSNKLGRIPIVGKGLQSMFKPFADDAKKSIGIAGERFTNFFKMKYKRVLKEGGTAQQALLGGLRVGFKGAETAIANTLNISVGLFRTLAIAALGVVAIIGAVILVAKAMAAAFKMGMERFKEIDAAAKSFRNETGLLNSQTTTLVGNIQTISADMANLGVSAEDVSKAASDFSNEFQGIEKPSEAVLSSMVMLNKNFGIGTTEASKLNKVFQNIGGLTAEQSQALIGQAVSMAKIAGVAPSQVIDDMANSSEVAYRYFQGSPQELAKAAVQAAKLGTSIAEAGKVADGLLDFQSSISSELKAQAMLGTNLNFAQARYLAANGDILGSQQAIIDQVQKNVDLTNLNTYEQQALAEATGMEFSSLQNQVRIRERFGKLNKEQLAAANALVDSGRDISSLTAKDLQDQTTRMARQQEMQSKIEKMQNTFKSLRVQIADAFAPFAETFVEVASLLGSVLVPVFKVLGSIIKVAFLPITFTFKVLRNMLDTIRTIRDEGFGGLVEKLKEMGPAMSFIVGLVTTLATIWVISILPAVLSTVASLAVGLVGALVTAIPFIVSMAVGFISAAIGAISTMSALTLGLGAIAIVGGIAAASAAANSSVQEGKSTVEGSIQDGVIGPDGNIITTDPKDFLIATKNPSELAQEVSGGGMVVDMSTTNALLQEAIAAFKEGRDVYMDNTKVTAKVTTTQDRSGRTNSFGINKG